MMNEQGRRSSRRVVRPRSWAATALIAAAAASLASSSASSPEEGETGGGGGGGRRRKWTVSWNAPFLSRSGYGSEAIANAVGLNRTLDGDRWFVSIGLHGDSIDESYAESLSDDLIGWMEDAARAQWAGVHAGEGPAMRPDRTVVICHSEPGAWWLPRPLYQTEPCPPPLLPGMPPWHAVVGRTMFETDRLPSGWEDRLNAVDEVWVPTEHHRRIFEDAGVRRVRVVGQGIDESAWDPEHVDPLPWDRVDRAGRCAEGDYRFLSVFKWERRKGHDALLRAFWGAFPPGGGPGSSGACLVVVTSLYHDSPKEILAEIEAHWAASSGRPPTGGRKSGVVLLSGLPAEDLIRLYRTADAFVLPSRGEGWGRPYMEAMAMGLPVIATNWSGPTEFVTEENGYLLPIRGLVDAGLEAFPGHRWADPDEEALRRLLVHLRDHPEEGRERGARARRDVMERWSHKAVAADMARYLKEIAEAPHRDWPMPPPVETNDGEDDNEENVGTDDATSTVRSDL